MEQMEFSQSIGKLAEALSAAQAEIKDAAKDAVNPHFKNRYATLASVRAAITPTFGKHKLSVAQYFEPHGDVGVCVNTLLMHSSGEWIKSRLFVPVSKKDAQGFGSAISYARRYALAAIANIAADEDDDAEQAVKPSKPVEVKAAPPAKNDVDVEALVGALKAATDAESMAKAILAVGRVKEKLSAAELKRCMDAREARTTELGMKQAS